MDVKSALKSAAGWVRRNVGDQEDYKASSSLVNRIRRSGLSGAAVGAGAGAVVGGTGGYLLGMSQLEGDQVTVSISTEAVTRPEVVGAQFIPGAATWIKTDDKGGGYFVHDPDAWEPLIEHKPTGLSSSRQDFDHSMRFGPVAGALIGLGTGTVIGAVAGALAQAVRGRAEGAPSAPEEAPRSALGRVLARAADKGPVAGASLGAIAGGFAGFRAGELSQDKAQRLVQTVQVPELKDDVIGWLPEVSDKRLVSPYLRQPDQEIRYADLPEARFGDTPFEGKQAVIGKVPTGRFVPTETSELSHRLNPLTGALVGVGVGAAAGLLGGVATGVLLKVVSGEAPPPAEG